MNKSLSQKIDFINEFSKGHTPVLMSDMYVCHGLDCEDCEFGLSKQCVAPVNIEPDEIAKIKDLFPEYFL